MQSNLATWGARFKIRPTAKFVQALPDMPKSHKSITTLNRQGADVGTQYRSAIFYHNEAQRKAAEASKATIQKDFAAPIVTEITAASIYYPAEDYHQDYYRLNPNAPYCQIVIRPKLEKLALE